MEQKEKQDNVICVQQQIYKKLWLLLYYRCSCQGRRLLIIWILQSCATITGPLFQGE